MTQNLSVARASGFDTAPAVGPGVRSWESRPGPPGRAYLSYAFSGPGGGPGRAPAGPGHQSRILGQGSGTHIQASSADVFPPVLTKFAHSITVMLSSLAVPQLGLATGLTLAADSARPG